MDCDYPGCEKKCAFEIFWESHDDSGKPSEPDYNNWKGLCNRHILPVIENHFGYPIDDIRLYGQIKSLPKLKEIINNPEKRNCLRRA
jgi:hypothetical protein